MTSTPRPRCSVFIATSLDGYISRPDGSIDWLLAANADVPAGEDCGYGSFMATIDAILMGRGTFETVLGFPEWPYASTPVWVMSRSLPALPDHLPPTVSLCRLDPADAVAHAQVQGHARLYVDGGQLIQSFLRAGLIHDMTITRIPVLLGAGRPLFGTTPQDIPLQLRSSQAYPFGFVQSVYDVVGPCGDTGPAHGGGPG